MRLRMPRDTFRTPIMVRVPISGQQRNVRFLFVLETVFSNTAPKPNYDIKWNNDAHYQDDSNNCASHDRMTDDERSQGMPIGKFLCYALKEFKSLTSARVTFNFAVATIMAVCQAIDLAVEASKGESFWNEEGHLAFLHEKRDPARKRRKISAMVKRSLSIELSNRRGDGLRTLSQLAQGFAVGMKKGPSVRTTGVKPGAAWSQDKSAMAKSTAADILTYNFYNAFLEMGILSQLVELCDI